MATDEIPFMTRLADDGPDCLSTRRKSLSRHAGRLFVLGCFVMMMLSGCMGNTSRIQSLYNYYSEHYPSSPRKKSVRRTNEIREKAPQEQKQKVPPPVKPPKPVIPLIAEITLNSPETRIIRNSTQISLKQANYGLADGDVLITGKSGGADIRLKSGRQFILGPETKIRLTRHVSKQKDWNVITVEAGTVYLKRLPADETDIQVETPQAVVGTQAASVVVRVGLEQTTIGALDKEIAVKPKPSGDTIRLLPGMMQAIGTGRPNHSAKKLDILLLTGIERDIARDFNADPPGEATPKSLLEAIIAYNEKQGIKRSNTTSIDNRARKPYFFYITPRYSEKNPFYHDIRSIGMFIRDDLAVGIETNAGYGSILAGIDVAEQDLTVFRFGAFLRKFFGVSFNMIISLHYDRLFGNLVFDDEELSTSNSAFLDSHCLSVLAGIGNQWVMDGGILFGIDWVAVPTPIARTYSLDFRKNSSGTSADQLKDDFSNNRPIMNEFRAAGQFMVYIGFAF